MKAVNIAVIGLAGTLSVSSMFQAVAAGSFATGREAVISRCLAQAHGHYPGKYWDWGQARGFAYRTCIFDAGFPP
jgi:hypothetical protein